MAAPEALPNFHLYHYWRSSSSWRVRAALSYKGISYTESPVNLLNDETEQPAYLAMNPVGTVPALTITDSSGKKSHLIESLAMIRYLELVKPSPSLLGDSPIDQARIWALTELINSGTHPIQNLPVLRYVSNSPDEQKKWAQHWISEGLQNFEKVCLQYGAATQFSYGTSLTVADLCLIPQCYNALRYEVDLTAFPTISRINSYCLTLPCFTVSHPDCFKPS